MQNASDYDLAQVDTRGPAFAAAQKFAQVDDDVRRALSSAMMSSMIALTSVQSGSVPRNEPPHRLSIAQNRPEWLVQLVREGARKLTRERHAREVGDLLAILTGLFRRRMAFADIPEDPERGNRLPTALATETPARWWSHLSPLGVLKAILDRDRLVCAFVQLPTSFEHAPSVLGMEVLGPELQRLQAYFPVGGQTTRVPKPFVETSAVPCSRFTS